MNMRFWLRCLGIFGSGELWVLEHESMGLE